MESTFTTAIKKRYGNSNTLRRVLRSACFSRKKRQENGMDSQNDGGSKIFLVRKGPLRYRVALHLHCTKAALSCSLVQLKGFWLNKGLGENAPNIVTHCMKIIHFSILRFSFCASFRPEGASGIIAGTSPPCFITPHHARPPQRIPVLRHGDQGNLPVSLEHSSRPPQSLPTL